MRDQLEGELRKRKLWNDNREMEYQTLRQEVLDGEFRLQKGGIKLTQARQIALDMSQKRDDMVNLLSSRTDLDSNTCEGRAAAARFNYLFACCLVYDETDKPYFPNNIDDYLLKQDDPVAITGATEFYYLISGNESVDKTLPENKFLSKFKFIDTKFRLIDKDGRLVTEDGKHIDDNGNLIEWDDDGNYTKVDPSGRAVNAKGDFDVEHSPFLDDEDVEIDESVYNVVVEDANDDAENAEVEEEQFSEASKPKAKRGRKKAVSAKSDEVVEPDK